MTVCDFLVFCSRQPLCVDCLDDWPNGEAIVKHGSNWVSVFLNCLYFIFVKQAESSTDKK